MTSWLVWEYMKDYIALWAKYQLFINTEYQTPDKTADTIAAFITRLTE